MRRSALPLLVAACIVVAAVLAWLVVQRTLGGLGGGADPGPRVSQTRTTDAFDRLDLRGHLDVEIVQGTLHEVVVDAPAGDQDRVRTRVDGRTLVVSAGDPRGGWRPFRRHAADIARVRITVPALESVALAGAVKLRAARLDVPALRVSASGATHVEIDALQAESLRFSGAGAVKAEIAGRVGEQSISLSGAGDIRAAGLASDRAKVSVAGAGRVVVRAEKSLDVKLSGAGSVEYYGNPALTQSVSGLGRVKRRDGDPSQRGRVRFELA